jgi:S1-C subfamily serine protease
MSIVRRFAMGRLGQVLTGVVALSMGLTAPTIAKAGTTGDQIASVVAKVSPAVVGIVVTRPPAVEQDVSAPKTVSADRPTVALGSGFIIDPSGFIATNNTSF